MSFLKRLKGEAGLRGERSQRSLASSRNSPDVAIFTAGDTSVVPLAKESDQTINSQEILSQAQNTIKKQVVQRKALRARPYQLQLALDGHLPGQQTFTENLNGERIPYSRDHETQLVERDVKLVATNNRPKDVMPDKTLSELNELEHCVSKLNMELSESRATIADLERECTRYQAAVEIVRNESVQERMSLWGELKAESEKARKTKQDLEKLIVEKSVHLEELTAELDFKMEDADKRYRHMAESMRREINAQKAAGGLARWELMKTMVQIEAEKERSECQMRSVTAQQLSVLGNALEEKGRRIRELDEQLQIEQQTTAQQLLEMNTTIHEKESRIYELEEQLKEQLEEQLQAEQQKTLALNRITNELEIEKRKVLQAKAEHERKDQQLEYIQQLCAGFKEKQMHFEGLIKQVQDFQFTGNGTSDSLEISGHPIRMKNNDNRAS